MKFQYRRSFNCLISAVGVVLILLVAFAILGLAPFGSRSFGLDEEYQALNYIRAVFDGKESILYTFSGTAGSGVFHRISEMMFSPLNYIVILGPQSQFETLYDVTILIKAAIAALSCAAFINYRFFRKRKEKTESFDLNNISCILVSILYAISGITFSGGLALADGMMIFPLIVLGVYKITIDKGAQTLIAALFLNLLFNWYSGFCGMVFAVIWLIFEMVLQVFAGEGFVKSNDLQSVLARVFRFIISIALAGGAASLLWFTAMKLTPQLAPVSSFTAATNLPGIPVLVMGVASLVILLVFNNCGYKIKVVVAAATAVMTAVLLIEPAMDLVTGFGNIDIGVRPVKYVLALLMIYITGLMFFGRNNFTKKPNVGIISMGAIGLLVIIQLITGVVVPAKNRLDSEVPAEMTKQEKSDLYYSLVSAVRELDNGIYRVAFVSDNQAAMSLLLSENENLYFEEPVAVNGDLISTSYSYAIKYFISKADLTAISGSEKPLGELAGYKVYRNQFNAPMAFLYDGSYFDAEFKEADAASRLDLSRCARMQFPTGMSIGAKDIKFSCDADKGDELFVSIPHDSNFKVKLNGETVIPKEYSGKFYTISLNEGINTIEMAYEPDFIGTMALISLLSLVLLVLFVFIENYYDMHYPER